MPAMDIYLDSNATTAVLPLAREAAMKTMQDAFGNPSSVHSAGLRARSVLDAARTSARRVLGMPTGRILFTSGATEGIQTAVLSCLNAWREKRDSGEALPGLLLYGATEHKAVPEALKHWNKVLCLGLNVQPIPVDRNGRHALEWLRHHAPQAAMVCTMAANNETGVVSDLDGIALAMNGSPALWLVDSVQALGKLDLRLAERRIDYAPFSGHKLYAPKGVGMLYVREGAPFTPLMAGGGQENAARSGTENMVGIAALGAVLKELERGRAFHPSSVLEAYRKQLVHALRTAFPDLVLNTPLAMALPTTVNFSVPGVTSRLLLEVFDAAGLRMSAGSACGSSRAQPSYVLEAMGLEAWRAASAVRLSFGAADTEDTIEEACRRIRQCGLALKASRLLPDVAAGTDAHSVVTRFAAEGECTYVVTDPGQRRCVVIDPRAEQVEPILQWMRCRGCSLVAVLNTAHDDGKQSGAASLKHAARALAQPAPTPCDPLGWPLAQDLIALGPWQLRRLQDGVLELWEHGALRYRFGADAAKAIDVDGDIVFDLPRHDPDARLAIVAGRSITEPSSEPLELSVSGLHTLLQQAPAIRLVDVRERVEQAVGALVPGDTRLRVDRAPMSEIINALPGWLGQTAEIPLVLVCRSGNRSAQAARALRGMGRQNTWSLAGGVALCGQDLFNTAMPEQETGIGRPCWT